MHPRDGEQRGLALELGFYFLMAALCLTVVLNAETIRQLVSGAMIAQLEASNPGQNGKRPDGVRAATASTESANTGGRTVELRADRRGHFQADVEVNGRRLEALVDTGASLIMLTYEDAQRAGVFIRDQDYTMRTQTANGVARAAPIVLDRVEIGGIRINNVQAAVAEPGRLGITLLGMTFLSRLQKFEIGSGRLVLHD